MRKETRALVEAGVMVSLAQVLSYVVLFQMPQGGSVTAGSMVPILLFSLRWGWKKGMMAGSVYGMLQFILGPKYTFHIVSLLFDYVVAFAALGLAGAIRPVNRFRVVLGAAVGVAGRFVCHFISGIFIWSVYAPAGVNPAIYSAVYNGSYLLPELAVSALLLVLIHQPISRRLDN